MAESLNLKDTFAVIKPNMGVATVAVTDTMYAELDENYKHFKNHLLVSEYSFNEDWPTWEMHPHGDEIVYLISGDVNFLLRSDGDERSVRLHNAGSFVVVPKNTWHTMKIKSSAKMLFITPGEGTQNVKTPPA